MVLWKFVSEILKQILGWGGGSRILPLLRHHSSRHEFSYILINIILYRTKYLYNCYVFFFKVASLLKYSNINITLNNYATAPLIIKIYILICFLYPPQSSHTLQTIRRDTSDWRITSYHISSTRFLQQMPILLFIYLLIFILYWYNITVVKKK